MVREDEVDVVRGPADHEDDCGEGEHLDDLLLVVPALGQGRLGHEEAQGGLAGCPEVAAHLGVAHSHAQHRQHVRQEEEEDVVAEIIQRMSCAYIEPDNENISSIAAEIS